jgi:UDP-N-acetylmuramoylalanine--D-glutamate ligase
LVDFLAFAHKRAGQNAISCGNVGLPLTAVALNSSVAGLLPIVEVSSFQAEDLRHFSPEAVIWSNFDEDHLDRHGDVETYFRAKHKLVERLLPAGPLIVGVSVVEAAKTFGISLPDDTIVARREDVADSIPAGSPFDSWPQRENWALAAAYWKARGLPLEHVVHTALATSLAKARPRLRRRIARARPSSCAPVHWF